MSEQIEYISQQAYARKIGCGVPIIARAIKTGKIPAEAISMKANGWPQINLAIAEQAWGLDYRYTRRKNKNRRESTDNTDKLTVKNTVKVVENTVKNTSTDDILNVELPEIDSKTSYKEADRLGKIADTQLKQLKVEEARGGLVKVETIERVFFDFSRMIRNNFQSISDRVIDQILSSQSLNEAHILLQTEIDQVLESISKVPEYRA